MAKDPPESSLGGLPLPSQGKMWPNSPWTLIRQGRLGTPSQKKEVLDRLLTVYYKPVSRFFQRAMGIHGDRLKDVVQDFFTRFVERDFLKNVTREVSFRAFLKVACRRHYINWCDAERARRPRHGAKLLSLHDAEGDALDVPIPEDRTSAMIDEELRSGILREALRRTKARLESAGKEIYFQILEARIPPEGEAPGDYKSLAARFDRSVYDIRNHLSAARKVLREMLLEVAAEGSEDPRRDLAALGL